MAPLEGICNPRGKLWDLLLHMHFPNSVVIKGGLAPAATRRAKRLDWQVAYKMVTYGSVVWTIDSFAPYKSPEMDGIFPALLQEGWEVLVPYLVKIFCACMATGHVPATWCRVKVVFIPKPGRYSYGRPKDYRPISLTSFLLKTMERLIDLQGMKFWYLCHYIPINMHTRLGNLWRWPFISLWFRLRRRLISRKTALEVFLDIEGAFNNTSYDSFCSALAKHGVGCTIIHWITATLKGRLATATLGGFSRSVTVARGCLQGGVLSTLLWCLVADELIARLSGGWGLHSRICG
jgi:hypothetical protein